VSTAPEQRTRHRHNRKSDRQPQPDSPPAVASNPAHHTEAGRCTSGITTPAAGTHVAEYSSCFRRRSRHSVLPKDESAHLVRAQPSGCLAAGPPTASCCPTTTSRGCGCTQGSLLKDPCVRLQLDLGALGTRALPRREEHACPCWRCLHSSNVSKECALVKDSVSMHCLQHIGLACLKEPNILHDRNMRSRGLSPFTAQGPIGT
jgi:hypothetical protein